MVNLKENQTLSVNSPIDPPDFSVTRAAAEYNAIAEKIEAEFGAIYRRRHVFADRRDAEISLQRIRESYRVISKGWKEQQRADRAVPPTTTERRRR
jgi:hypothetical protein